MQIVYAKEFQKQFKKLPHEIQNLFQKQELIFRENWRDPRLQVKKLKDHPLPFSFRITRGYLLLWSDSDGRRRATERHGGSLAT